MAGKPMTFKERWIGFSENYPALSNQISKAAQKLLKMDRIDPSGVEDAVNSPEMAELADLARTHREEFALLGVTSENPKELLRAVDLFAIELIFHYEKKSVTT